MTSNNWHQRSVEHIWYPSSQMKDYEHFPVLPIKNASGIYLELEDGRKIIDAISSWWTKSLGHNHPRIKKALIEQAEHFEHAILANTTNATIIELSERLSALSPQLEKVFYASDGSSAVEIAMKLAVQAQAQRGEKNRTQFMALENSYHGDTALTLSVCNIGLFRDAYSAITHPYPFIKHVPYVNSKNHPLWNDCSDMWPAIETQLAEHADTLAGIIVEPIVQGAGGLKLYSQDFLKRLRNWCSDSKVYFIADEIMTGFYRTGLPLACQHADIEPDFLCLAKGLTSGWLPMSATLTTNEIYDLFYDDYESCKGFMHSHTFSGNVLAAATALETLKIYDDENIQQKVETLEPLLFSAMQEVANKTGKLENIRHIGAIVVADIKGSEGKRLGFETFKRAVKLGALLRPIGNTLYWLPPFTIKELEINRLRDITVQALEDY